MKKKKKKSHFTRNLFIFICFSLLIMAGILYRFWNYLADYQQALPSMLGDKIFMAYKSYDTITLRQYCSNLPDALQDDFNYQDYLREHLDRDSLYYYESSMGKDQNTISYIISSNNQEFAELTVTKTGEKSKYGFPLYEITSLEQLSQITCRFEQAAGTTILLNGKPIDASYCISQETVASAFDEISAGPFENDIFEIPDNEVSFPITVENAMGEEITPAWNEEHTICTSSFQVSDSLKQEISNFAQDACKAYAVFATVKNASRNTFLSYLYPDTEYQNIIKSYDNTYGIDKNNDEFLDVSVTDIMQYSETEFTCDVSLVYHIVQGNNQKDFPLSFGCYITSRNGNLQLLRLDVK